MKKEKKTKEENIVAIVQYKNDKTRKGLYIYVKGKGKAGRYYEYDEHLGKYPYIQHYKNKYYKHQHTTIKSIKDEYRKLNRKERRSIEQQQRKQLEAKLTELERRRPRLTNLLKGGTNSTKLVGLKQSSQSMNEALKNLYKPFVIDPDLLKIIIQEENQQKLRYRQQHDILLYRSDNTLLAVMTHIGKKTLREVHKELLEIFKGDGIEILDNYPSIARKATEKGYRYQHQQNGKLHHIEIITTFRKEK